MGFKSVFCADEENDLAEVACLCKHWKIRREERTSSSLFVFHTLQKVVTLLASQSDSCEQHLDIDLAGY